MKLVLPSDQPFVRHQGFWHALESSCRDGSTHVNKAVCGMEIRARLEGMTTWEGEVKPHPYCLNCVQSFNDPNREHD